MGRVGLGGMGRVAKDPAAKLPDTVGFAPRGGLRVAEAGRV